MLPESSLIPSLGVRPEKEEKRNRSNVKNKSEIFAYVRGERSYFRIIRVVNARKDVRESSRICKDSGQSLHSSGRAR